MFYLSLHLIFRGVSRFPVFPSNPCFLRRYPVLPRVLHVVPRMVRGGRAGGGVGPCVARRRLQPRTGCYPGVQFILPARSPIPGPSPATILVGDWGAELRRSSVSRTSQQRLHCVRLPTPVIAKGVLPFSLT